MTENLPPLADNFWENLLAKYQNPNKARLATEWAGEEPALRNLIPTVLADLPNIYTEADPIDVGGGGIVFRVRDTSLGVYRALKIPRPVSGQEQIIANILASEVDKLVNLVHTNLMPIYARGAVQHNDVTYPWYIMEFLTAQDSDKFLSKRKVSADDFFQILDQLLDAVAYMHEEGTVHLDIKPGNISLKDNLVPVLMDFGFAKRVTPNDDALTGIGGTDGYIHPDLYEYVIDTADENRNTGQAPRAAVKPAWDLFSLGRTILKLVDIVTSLSATCMTPYERRYVRLLAARLLDGYNTDEKDKVLGLGSNTYKHIKYKSAREAQQDLRKLTGSYNLEKILPELDVHNTATIQTSSLLQTTFSKRLGAVISDPAFMRLNAITQLGLVNLVYPTGIHSRFEHSLGTYTVTAHYILALYNDRHNPLFRQLATEQGLKACLLAGLLHDLGQYPLAHDLEEADRDFFSHERFSIKLLQSENLSIRKTIEDSWGITTEDVLKVLTANVEQLEKPIAFRMYKSLLDGPFDADKIDYLTRDSQRLGLTYGSGIDVGKLMRSLTIIFKREEDETYVSLSIHEKGKIPAESVAFCRYAMFGQVYWHHAYRGIKSVIQRIAWEALEKASDRSKLRREFYDFLLKDVGGTGTQASLEFGDSGSRRYLSQIQAGDYEILRWLADRGGSVATKLLDGLVKRQLMKRVLVIMPTKSKEAKQVYELLEDFEKDNKRKWKTRLHLQRSFQEEIRMLAEKRHRIEGDSVIITDDIRSRFLAAALKDALIVLDLPASNKSDRTLEYIAEQSRRSKKFDQFELEDFGTDSKVWSMLQESYRTSIGRFRVFAQSEYADYLASALTENQILLAIRQALRKVGELDQVSVDESD